jgi:hypothetical protein
MEICRKQDGLEISEIDPFLAELLRQIPESTNTEDAPMARARLFSAPAGEGENEFCEEWKLYVQPGLERLFQTATETVAMDLRSVFGNEKAFANCRLWIPADHADAWLNALNQARLTIASKHGFTEKELCDQDRSPVGSRRDLSLFQVNFYGFLQEVILRELEIG